MEKNMIHFLRGTDLFLQPKLAASMFKDRNKQFVERLAWQLQVDQNGFERDEYDDLNPVYVIIENEDGLHDASLRLMPTTGRTMINEYFLDALGGRAVRRRNTWECTRFCISPAADRSLAIELLAATGRLMSELQITRLVAVYDRQMKIQYRRSNISPTQLGWVIRPEGSIYAGQWSFSKEKMNDLSCRSRIYGATVEISLANSPLTASPGMATA